MNSMFGRRKKIGLALGAGGARGIAHIGVLRLFESRSIPIDVLVGTSIGALVGGAFASGIRTRDLQARVDAFLQDPIFLESSLESIRQLEADKKLSLVQKIQGFFKNRFLLAQALFRPGMLHEEDFQAMIDFFIPDIRVQDTLIPFRADLCGKRSWQAAPFPVRYRRIFPAECCWLTGEFFTWFPPRLPESKAPTLCSR